MGLCIEMGILHCVHHSVFVWLQSILEKKKNKGILKVGQSRSGGLIISQKQG